jgi:hypothetical protein
VLAAASGHNADRSAAPITAARWRDSEQRHGASADIATSAWSTAHAA